MTSNDNPRKADDPDHDPRTESHADAGPPEARVPGDELHDLIDSWEWMHDAAEPQAGDHDELAEMYQMAICHCIADLRRVLSRHE
jgi:hypothetical protein